MGLNNVLVDRGRLIKRSFGARVRGETQIQEVVGNWIKCRIDPDNLQETRSPSDKFDVRSTHQFICSLKDTLGVAVTLNVDDRIEIEKYVSSGVFSPQGVYIVRSVQVPRSVRKNILIVANIERLIEN